MKGNKELCLKIIFLLTLTRPLYSTCLHNHRENNGVRDMKKDVGKDIKEKKEKQQILWIYLIFVFCTEITQTCTVPARHQGVINSKYKLII